MMDPYCDSYMFGKRNVVINGFICRIFRIDGLYGQAVERIGWLELMIESMALG
jgi:hypothetical protein